MALILIIIDYNESSLLIEDKAKPKKIPRNTYVRLTEGVHIWSRQD